MAAVATSIKAFSYQAVEEKGRRQTSPKATKHEDIQLPISKRKKLYATAEDQQRNYSLVAWAIRKHISYVSQFNFKVRTDNDDLTKALERKFKTATKRRNYDIAQRHGMHSGMALFESSKVVKGDCVKIKIANSGGAVQMVEADLIAYPDKSAPGGKLPEEVTDHVNKDTGLILGKFGNTEKLCICRWGTDGKTKVFDRLVDADDCFYSGYFSRFAQSRGISPLTAALNQYKDLYESYEWTLLKIKAHALLGFAFKRDAGEDDGLPTRGVEGYDTDADGAEQPEPGYSIDMSGNIINLDLEPGDDVDMLESSTPNSGAIEFWKDITRVALLAVDIPYVMYDPTSSNKSQYDSAVAQYLASAKEKQRANRELLEEWRDWQLELMLANDPELRAMVTAAYGDDIEALQETIQVIPIAMPVVDLKGQAEGYAALIAQGMYSRQRACMEMNIDFYTNADELAEEEAYLAHKGVTVVIGQPGQGTTAEQETASAEIETPEEEESANVA